jgi:OOP family OmpA-OmpF porin
MYNGRILSWVFVALLMAETFRIQAQGQTEEIAVKGNVTNAVTGKGIKAMIIYKSMPTGGISGRFNDSTFKFSIFGTARYQITAEAKGFIPRTVIVDPKDIDTTKMLQRDIQLTAEGQTITLNTLKFDQNKAIINPKSFQELDEVVAMMHENPKMIIQLEGHTDGSGDAKVNMKLSEERVDVVKKYFVSKGIPKASVKTKAFGGTKPISKNSNLNRRVEMRVLKD